MSSSSNSIHRSDNLYFNSLRVTKYTIILTSQLHLLAHKKALQIEGPSSSVVAIENLPLYLCIVNIQLVLQLEVYDFVQNNKELLFMNALWVNVQLSAEHSLLRKPGMINFASLRCNFIEPRIICNSCKIFNNSWKMICF